MEAGHVRAISVHAVVVASVLYRACCLHSGPVTGQRIIKSTDKIGRSAPNESAGTVPQGQKGSDFVVGDSTEHASGVDIPAMPVACETFRGRWQRPAACQPGLSSRKLFTMYGDQLAIPEGAEKHPCWHFEAFQLGKASTVICSVVLCFAGALCAAGGIGGGGVYVTVLMVAGGLGLADAVPLSKATVFIGSISSLVLNIGKSAGRAGPTLIDWNLCRLIVPSSLGGTYVGVLLNRVLPTWVIALLLTLLLVGISALLVHKTWVQYREETATPNALANIGSKEQPAVRSGGHAVGGRQVSSASSQSSYCSGQDKPTIMTLTRDKVSWKDVVLTGGLLLCIVFFSVFRYHAGTCQHADWIRREELCHPPIFRWLGKNTLHRWMTNGPVADALGALAFFIPLIYFLLVVGYYSKVMVWTFEWSVWATLQYSVMSLITGCLAGLMGIGGGLIFAPFLLLMQVEPAIAVATSSTCVIFTAASTSLQYLLTDRIIMSLAVIYGIINIVASYAGTRFVHYLQDKFSARRSYISGIVGLGVLISTVLAVLKLAEKLAEEFGPHENTMPASLH